MNRKELDAFVEHHRLDAAHVELALTLARARPAPAETLRFVIRASMLAGIVSLAAGMVFFVAANWDALRVAGRFALLEAVLLGSLALALLRPAPRPVARYALLTAFVTTGALLALFGQTYQTGADVYELFLTWAALGLPFVLAAQWSVLWAAWVLVLNIALALFCGFRPADGLLWILFSGFRLTTPTLLLIATLVNLALWALAELAHNRMPAAFAALTPPSWLCRFILACALSFATWTACFAVVSDDHDGASVAWVAVILAAVVAYTARRRIDVFPLALVSASIIAIVTSFIAQLGWRGQGSVIQVTLLLAVWLILSSTASGRIMMHLLKTWRTARESE
jgi:uncharacterized membrane protein